MKSAGATQVQLDVTIHASRDRVWKVMVEDIGRWWREDFYTIEKPRSFKLEPRLGGRMYEDDGVGGGLSWYQVTGIQPPRLLQLVGHLAPPYGGPATSLLRLSLESPDGAGTVLHVSDAIFGLVDEKTETSVREGWRLLFEEGLKPYVERQR